MPRNLSPFAILLLGCFLLDAAHAQDRIWRPYLELEGRGSSLRFVGQGNAFLPLVQDTDSLVFADFRGLWTDSAAAEGNFGMAYRRKTASNWIVGLNSFFDMRHSELGNDFVQGTLGAELLNESWGFRANGYLPELGTKSAASLNGAFLQGNAIVVRPGLEAAYYGVDFEAERLLWCRDGESCKSSSRWSMRHLDAEIWAAAGMFHFDNDETGFKNITGPRARAELRLYDLPMLGTDSRLVASGQYEFDDIRGSVGTGMLTVRIPFGHGGGNSGYRLTGLNRRMVAPIVRDIDIITNAGAFGRAETAKFASNDRVIANAIVIDGGTFDPEGDFLAAGPDSLVAFSGDAGPILADSPFLFNDGQVALGGGSSILVYGCDTGAVAAYTAPGSRPTIMDANNMVDIFTLNDNTTIKGMNILGGNSGILSFGGSQTIADNHISGAAAAGATLLGNMTGDITGNSFDDNGLDGLSILGSLTGNVANNSFNENQFFGLFIANGVKGDVANNFANGNGAQGLSILGDVTGNLANNTANGNGVNAVQVNELGRGINVTGNVDGSVTGNVANDNFGGGIRVEGGVTGGVSSNNADRNGEQGVYVVGRVAGDVASNNTDDNFDEGLLIEGGLGGNAFGNVASNNGASGFSLLLSSGDDVRFRNNRFSGNNGGSAEEAVFLYSDVGSATVRLQDNTSNNSVPGGTFNYFFDNTGAGTLNVQDQGGNVGTIGGNNISVVP